jgi:uncharacterized membrane protein YdjX (TVP38/TMEM64 family)
MNNKPSKTTSISIIAVSILIMVLAAIIFTQDLAKVKAFISRAGPWGIIVSIVIYALLGVTLIPSEPLTLFIGALFGPFLATIIAGTGNTFSALIEYYLGTHIGSAANFIERKDKLPFGLGKLNVDSLLFLIGARMIPGYAPKIVSTIAGIYRVPLVRYLWTTAIPVFIGSAVFAFSGHGLGALLKIK